MNRDEWQMRDRKQGHFWHYDWQISPEQGEVYIPVVSESVGRLLQSSVDTPGFRALKKKDLPINNYDFRTWRRGGNIRRLRTDPSGYYMLSIGNLLWSTPQATEVWDSPADLSEIAKNKLIGQIQGSKINLSQAFVERKQVVNMVATTASRLAQSFISLKRGNLSHAMKSLGLSRTPPRSILDDYRYRYSKNPFDAATSAWLELQYGWKPLLSDIYGAAELLAEKMVTRPPICTIETFAKREIAGSFFEPGPWAEDKLLTTYRCKYHIEFCTSNEIAEVLGKTGISNPLLLAWEVVPYSFVVDWFLPVGKYLDSFTAFDGLEFRSGYYNSKTSVVGKYQPRDHSDGFWTQKSEGSAFFEGRRMVRSKLLSFPRASFPTLKNPFSKSHLASAISLLFQAFRR